MTNQPQRPPVRPPKGEPPGPRRGPSQCLRIPGDGRPCSKCTNPIAGSMALDPSKGPGLLHGRCCLACTRDSATATTTTTTNGGPS